MDPMEDKNFVHNCKIYKVAKEFFNLHGKDNVADANEYLTKHPNESVLWSNYDNTRIIIVANDDLGMTFKEKYNDAR